MTVDGSIHRWVARRSRRLRPRSGQRHRRTWSRLRTGLPAAAATLLLVVSCGGADGDEGTSGVQDTTVEATEAPSTTTATTTATTPASSAPEASFADFVADADQVLGPLELDGGRRFAVLGYAAPSGPLGDGSIELLVEDPESGWASEHEITVAGMPVSITAPGDLDDDGLDEIQVDWVVDEDTDFALLYRIDVEQLELVRIPFVRSELHEPMDDYAIVSVEPGFVSTSVERCDPDCTTYTVTWRYDSATDRLVVHTQPAPTPDASGTRIPPGVIEDGTHYGYLTESSDGSFTFDRADVQADGSWTNVNPKLRTLPYAGSVPWPSGTPIEVIVDDQRVTSVSATTSGPPTPTDPLRIPAGVIEDGTHYGYFVSYQPGAFVFDRVDVLPNGEWQNLNPMTRTLPIWVDVPLPPGTPIEVVIVDQHVARLSTL